jgi:hydroxyacylglutathione hydrolase
MALRSQAPKATPFAALNGETMPLLLETIPCLADNYAYLIHDPDTLETALIDAPEAAPILARLSEKGWTLGQIFITHHHSDHIDGVAELVGATGAQVLGGADDAHRLPPLTRALREGDTVQVGAYTGRVLDVSGHTIGHIAFVFDSAGEEGETFAFTADSLMAAGCGRLFEGAPAQMWASLQKLMALPDDTWVCSGHEYTTSNLAFAAHVDGANPALQARIEKVAAARAANRPTVPSRLSGERATNPFLRAGDAALKAAIGNPDASDSDTFAALRAMKDSFRG